MPVRQLFGEMNSSVDRSMNILLVGNYAPDAQTSMLAFGRMLERELPKLGCEVRVVAPAQRLQRVADSSRWWKWLGYLDKFILFIPTLARHGRWADVIHICDHSNAMYARWLQGKPVVITCHDVIAIQAARGMVEGWDVSWSGRLFQRLISRGLSLVDAVVCVSGLTARDLLALKLALYHRVQVVPNGLNDDFSFLTSHEARQLVDRLGIAEQDRYLLHVGSDLPRKNRSTVVKAFIALGQQAIERSTPALAQYLVLVGPPLQPDMMALLSGCGLGDRVKVFQDVSHPQLRALYTRATALLFPSLQEGFGWPIIEAQACGCPVFASDLPPMNEVGGSGACYVDPRDPEAVATVMAQAAGRLPEMRALGLQNASQYSAARMMASYLGVYLQVLSEKRAPIAKW